jgi:hypothetical protein
MLSRHGRPCLRPPEASLLIHFLLTGGRQRPATASKIEAPTGLFQWLNFQLVQHDLAFTCMGAGHVTQRRPITHRAAGRVTARPSFNGHSIGPLTSASNAVIISKKINTRHFLPSLLASMAHTAALLFKFTRRRDQPPISRFSPARTQSKVARRGASMATQQNPIFTRTAFT